MLAPPADGKTGCSACVTATSALVMPRAVSAATSAAAKQVLQMGKESGSATCVSRDTDLPAEQSGARGRARQRLTSKSARGARSTG